MFMGRLSKHVFAFIASSHVPTVHPRTMKSPQQPSLVGAGLCACAEISSAGAEARRHRFLSSLNRSRKPVPVERSGITALGCRRVF